MNGPMARSLEDLETFCSVVLDGKPALIDWKCVGKPWTPVRVSNPKFGILKYNGASTPLPPIQRGMDIVEKSLQKAGYETVEFNFEKTGEILKLFLGFLTADGGKRIRDSASKINEELPKAIQELLKLNPNGLEMSATKLWDLNAARYKLANEFLEYYDSLGIDCIIAPVSPTPSAMHGMNRSTDYTSPYNVMDMPGVVTPVTTVDLELDQLKDHHKFNDANPIDKLNWTGYKPELYEGAPVCVQVVGRRFDDEKIFDLARTLDACIKQKYKL